jgi:hypothetical protein
VLTFLGEIKDDRLLVCLIQYVNPNKMMKDPTNRRMVNSLAFWVGKRCLLGFERLADAVFQAGIYQQTHRHHPQQRHDALGFFRYSAEANNCGFFKNRNPRSASLWPL